MKRLFLTSLLTLSLSTSFAQTDSTSFQKIGAKADSLQSKTVTQPLEYESKGKYWAMGVLAFTGIVVYLLFNVRSDR